MAVKLDLMYLDGPRIGKGHMGNWVYVMLHIIYMGSDFVGHGSYRHVPNYHVLNLFYHKFPV